MAGAAPHGPAGWSRRGRAAAVALGAALPVVAVLVHGPVVRGGGFHRYADRRTLAGIPDALDVLSNAIFVVAAALGAARAGRRPGAVPAWLWGAICAAMAAVGVGSAVYHLRPGDGRLLGDFLPIDALAALLVAVCVADRIDGRAGALLAPPAVAAFAAGSLVWYAGARAGAGDLRWHGAAQAVAVAAALGVVLLFPGGALRTGGVLAAVAAYGLARVCAAFDGALYAALGVSGHTLKHLAAGAATILVVRAATAGPRPARWDTIAP